MHGVRVGSGLNGKEKLGSIPRVEGRLLVPCQQVFA